MAIKSLVSSAWQEIDTLKVPVSGAYQEADHANALVSGAWQEVWGGIGYTFTDMWTGNSSQASYATATANGDSVSFSLTAASYDGTDTGYAAIHIVCPDAAIAAGDTVTWSCTITVDSIDIITQQSGSSAYYAYGHIINDTTSSRVALCKGDNPLSRTFTAAVANDRPWIHIELSAMYTTTIKGTISDVRINGKKCVFDF